MSLLLRYFLIFIFGLMLSACQAINQQRLKGPGWYLVKPTDTLYSIAWRYGIDYKTLATWNGLGEPFQIKPGQQLILVKPDEFPTVAGKQKVIIEKSETGKPVIVKSLTTEYNKVIRWRWPTQGKVLNRFSVKALDRRGIDIAGKIGQPVYAVADGSVVYSGNGLADYANLIIIKHNETYLSAYAYNQKRLVQEGVHVKKGAKIAQMGQGKNNVAALHFEIRKNGDPVDPLLYLPEL
jgi:lipoprotein NlpD